MGYEYYTSYKVNCKHFKIIKYSQGQEKTSFDDKNKQKISTGLLKKTLFIIKYSSYQKT